MEQINLQLKKLDEFVEKGTIQGKKPTQRDLEHLPYWADWFLFVTDKDKPLFSPLIKKWSSKGLAEGFRSFLTDLPPPLPKNEKFCCLITFDDDTQSENGLDNLFWYDGSFNGKPLFSSEVSVTIKKRTLPAKEWSIIYGIPWYEFIKYKVGALTLNALYAKSTVYGHLDQADILTIRTIDQKDVTAYAKRYRLTEQQIGRIRNNIVFCSSHLSSKEPVGPVQEMLPNVDEPVEAFRVGYKDKNDDKVLFPLPQYKWKNVLVEVGGKRLKFSDIAKADKVSLHAIRHRYNRCVKHKGLVQEKIVGDILGEVADVSETIPSQSAVPESLKDILKYQSKKIDPSYKRSLYTKGTLYRDRDGNVIYFPRNKCGWKDAGIIFEGQHYMLMDLVEKYGYHNVTIADRCRKCCKNKTHISSVFVSRSTAVADGTVKRKTKTKTAPATAYEIEDGIITDALGNSLCVDGLKKFGKYRFTLGGVTKTISQWAKIYNINVEAVRFRFKKHNINEPLTRIFIPNRMKSKSPEEQQTYLLKILGANKTDAVAAIQEPIQVTEPVLPKVEVAETANGLQCKSEDLEWLQKLVGKYQRILGIDDGRLSINHMMRMAIHVLKKLDEDDKLEELFRKPLWEVL